MQTITRSAFTTVKTEGGLLPADLLQRIADGDDLPGLRPADYHLYEGERVNEAVTRAWNRCAGAWKGFKAQSEKLSTTDSGTTLTRERWLLVLFQELGFGRLPSLRGGLTVGDASFPISHLWQTTPIHLVTFRQGLDQRSEVSTAVKRSPHSLMQELLNRSPEHLWGMISNGLHLRILRDNASLRRAAFVEFDLAAIMQYELYAEFALLWMVCHQSRFEPFAETTKAGAEKAVRPAKAEETDEADDAQEAEPEQTATTCWLEVWSKTAAERGTRALDALRDGVKEAVEALGTGFLAHRENGALRDKLREGTLRRDDYYRQLRRMVYRLIFLAVAEDRDLLLLPDTSTDARQLYSEHYSLRRLRNMSVVVRGGPHPDLHRQLRLLFFLVREGYPGLGLPGLGSFLFSGRSTPDLDTLELANQHLLTALRGLSFAVEGRVRRPVDFRNLDSEELGSIYESLLELHPEVNLSAATFMLSLGAGSERKTTGSHYTPTSLVESLLDTALEPVVADRLAKAEEQWRKSNDRTPENLCRLQDAAILSIKVLDGASGSGHMLIGAGRRLAHHLARIHTGDDEPSPEALRHAMRDVVRRCLYGVDVNDMAVELCKVALWMESMEPGKPLSFLDAHIQCGNSLIGVTPGLDISEIPDDAFQPVTGDDKTTAAGLRKRNKKEREGQLALQFGDTETMGSTERHASKRAQMVAAIENLTEDAVAQVTVKEKSYDGYLHSSEYASARLEADIWTAAFFWPIPAADAGRMAAPTQEVLCAVRAGKYVEYEMLLRQVGQLAAQYQFFHWALQFPEIFDRETGGFDVELMNPPWERIKLQEKEWFAARSPAIAIASNAAERKRMIKALQTEDSVLWQAFQDDVRGADNESHFIRSSGHYPLCGRGDVNTYAVFAELVRQVLSPNGRAGIIVPTGVATDDTTKFYFQDVMETGALVSLFDFENRHKIFPAVDSRMKFCLMTLRGQAESAGKAAEFVFFALDTDDLRDEERRFSLTAREILLLNPNTRTCPIFRSRKDAELNKRVYNALPVLYLAKTGMEGQPGPGNPWGIMIRRMFDMDDREGRFRTVSQLTQQGFVLTSQAHFSRNDEDFVPLYEAKNILHFDHRFGTFEQTSERERISGKCRALTSTEKTPDRSFLPRFWVSKNDFERMMDSRPDYVEWLLGFREITNATNERTFVGTVIPRTATGRKIPQIFVARNLASGVPLLLANMSSFILDYLARCKTAGTTMAYFIIEQLPFLPPHFLFVVPGIDSNNWVHERVLELTYTAWDLQPFARDCGYNGPPFRWDEARRFLLRCELDAAYFHLYGIKRDDVDYIMDTFPIVKRKDIAKHGEYRTKRVILEMYDEMAAATRTGVAYQTKLDPPPADPRAAHAAQGSS